MKNFTQTQLYLPIQQHNEQTFANFYGQNNQLLLQSLNQSLAGSKEQFFFYLWGSAGYGKTHLLKASCYDYSQQNKSCSYLPLNELAEYPPNILDNLHQQDLVALDNLDAIAGNFAWELAIFNLFNQIKESGNCILLISASISANQLELSLNDLRSRLNSGEVYQLHALDEEQKIIVLQMHAQERCLDLSNEVASFLLKRVDRDMHNLLQTFDQLYHAALQNKHKLTIPFIKETLNI